jgi:hypothetical protein
MKLHTLLTSAQESQATGDITAESPVFAVVRNAGVPSDSADAWHAISIVALEVDPDDGSLVFLTDAADEAAEMTVATLRARVRKLPDEALRRELFVGGLTGTASSSDGREDVMVVEAYGDEHGLGLMVWFEGYEDWIGSQA